jgi:ssDNA-binding Zn-finger/Zn-ribbon topoisomerase 1
MHEKIAILDGRILWHGSLNILSHRDTHESMLRIESPTACQQLGRFISTPTPRREESPALDAPENPQCPLCGGPTVWNSGRFGIWFECECPNCDGKVDARQRSGTGRGRRNGGHRGTAGRGARVVTSRPCPRSGCHGRLAVRNGRFGRFLGCTNYPACRYSEDFDEENNSEAANPEYV